MANTIQIKRRTSGSGALGSLAVGELGVDLTDSNKLYVGSSSGNQLLNPTASTNADTVDSLHATSFLRSDASDTASGDTYTFSSGSTSVRMSFTGHAGASNYNYFLNAFNDSGTKAVHFVNGSTRSGDGGPNAYTIRNDGGKLILGRTNQITDILGSAVSVTGNLTVGGHVSSETIRSSRSDGDVYIQATGTSDFVSIGNQTTANIFKVESTGATVTGNLSVIYNGSASVRTYNGVLKSDFLENSAGANHLTIRTEAGGNKNVIIDPDGTGITQIYGNLSVVGTGTFSGHVTPSSNFGYDLGTSSLKWSNVHAFQGNFGASGSGGLTVSGNATINNNLTVAGSCTFAALSGTTANFSGTVTCNGSIDLQDNDKLLLGAGNDLEIYHDGSNSYVHDNGTGDLILKGDNVRIKTGTANDDVLRSYADGAVELYHNDAKKFETTSSGVSVTGSVTGNKLSLPLEEANDYKIVFTAASGSGHAGISTVDQSGAGLYIGANSYANASGTPVAGDSNNPSSGIYFDGWSQDRMRFYIGASGNPTEKMTLDSSGNLTGTGTLGTSASRWSTIYGSAGDFSGNLTVSGSCTFAALSGTTGTFSGKVTSPNLSNKYHIPNTGGSASWIKLGNISTAQSGRNVFLRIVSASGYNALVSQNTVVDVYFRTSNGSSSQSGNGTDGGSFYGSARSQRHVALGTNTNSPSVIRIVQVSNTSYDFYGSFNTFVGTGSFYEVTTSTSDTWTNSGTTVSEPTTGTLINTYPSSIPHGFTASGTAGKVAIWSSDTLLTTDTNLNWDATNDRLGIGVTPSTPLHSSGTIRVGTSPFTDYKASQQYSSTTYEMAIAGSNTHFNVADSSNSAAFRVTPSSKRSYFFIPASESLTDYGGLTIQEPTNSRGLSMGYDHSAGYFWMYARDVGVGSKGINLNNSFYVKSGGGNCGIGSTNPQDKLNIHDSSSSANLGLKITRGSQTHGLRLGVNDSHAFLWTDQSQDIAFANNDSERLTIKSSTGYVQVHQRLGVGTASPSEKLHIVDDSDPTIRITNTDGGTNDTAAFELGVSSNIAIASTRIEARRQSDGSVDLNFRGAGTTSVAQTSAQMTLDGATGNFGIGCTPSAKLHVQSGDVVVTSGKQLISTNAYTQAPPAMLTTVGPSTGATPLSSGSWGIMMGPEVTRSTASNVYYPGIAFNHLLNHNGVSTWHNHPQAWIGTRLHDTTGSERAFLVFSTKSGTGLTSSDVPIERMCIDPVDGFVGIGQTEPKADLHIGSSFSDAANDLGTAALAIKQTGTSAENGIYIERTGERKGYYIGITGVDGLTFRRNFSGTKSDIVSLTRDGNVGINQTAPSAKLHVVTSSVGTTPSTSLDDLVVENNGAGGITLVNRNDAAAGIAFADDDQAIAGLISYNHNGNSLRFTTNGNTEAMRIDSSQRLGIGTASATNKLTVTSGAQYTKAYLSQTADIHIANTSGSGVGSYAGAISFCSTAEANLQAASIAAIQTGSDQNQIGLTFNTQVSTAGSTDLAESVRIRHDGVMSLTSAGNTQVNNYYASLIINNTGNSTWSRLRFDRSGVERWGIGLGTDDKLRISNLFTGGTAASPDDDCFVINNNGSVGIGVDPSYELEVAGSISNYGDGKIIRLRSNDQIIGQIENRGTGADYDKGYFRLFDTGTAKVVLDSAGTSSFRGGSVAIGVSSTTHKLQVNGTVSFRPNGSSNNQHYFTTGGANNAKYMQYNSAGALINQFATDTVSYITGGNFGIGTTSPTQPLTLKRSSAGQGEFGLRFEFEDTSGPTSTSSAILVGTYGLKFKNYNSSRNFLFETGNVGIGSSPSAKLHVNGDSYFATDMGIGMMASSTYRLSVSDTNNTPAQFLSTTNSLNLTLGSATQTNYTNILMNSNSGNAQIWKHGGSSSGYGGTSSLNIYCSNGAIAFHPGANTNEVIMHSDGDTDFAARVGIGGAHSGSYGLYVHGTSYFGNNIYGADADHLAVFGRARVGYIGWSDYAGFAHRDQAAQTTYALLQDANGSTFLNSASGQSIYFRQANSNVGGIVSGNWGLGTISPGSYKLYVNGTSYLGGNSVLGGDLFFGSTSGSVITTSSGVLRHLGDNGVKLETYSGGWQERLVIADDGKVSIGGTTSSSRRLFVTSSIASSYMVEFANTHGTAGYGVLIKAGDDNNVTALSVNDKDGNEKLRVRAGGQITFANAYTFPTSIGSAGQVLKVPSSGTTLEWGTGSGSGTVNETHASSTDHELAVHLGSSTVGEAHKLWYNSTHPGLSINTDDGSDTSSSVQLYVDGGAQFTRIGCGSTPNSSYSAFFSGNIYSNGDIGGYSKSFRIPHPTKEGMNLRHSSLEGPEIGVYQRGEIQGDTIELPDYWVGLVRDGTVTVQLTPKGSFQQLYVVSASNTEVRIAEANGADIDCYYTIYGERADVERYDVEYEGQV